MRVIAGGLSDVTIGAIVVSFLGDDEAHLYVPDADVEEQDRYLALAKPRDVIFEDKNRLKTFTRIHEEQPRELGSVHLLRGVMRAVVIDLDADITCDPLHVELAAGELIRIAREAKLVNVRMPVLGSRHGGLALDVAARAIAKGFAKEAGQAIGEKSGEKTGESTGEAKPHQDADHSTGRGAREETGEERGREQGREQGREMGKAMGKEMGKEIGKEMGKETVHVAIVAPRDVLPMVAENFTRGSAPG